MRTTTISATAVALFLAACTADQAPERLSAPDPALAAGAVSSLCDFSRLKSDARAYFASSNDAVFTVIGDLQSASRGGPNATATDKAFDGLVQVAQARLTTRQKAGSTAAQGAAVALDFMGCMESYVTDALPSATQLAWSVAQGGIFAVRGGATDPATGGVFVNWSGLPLATWGVQPQASKSWTDIVANRTGSVRQKRFLIYGWSTNAADPITSTVTFRQPLASPATFTGAVGVELNTVPAPLTFVLPNHPIVGVCDAATTGTTYPRVQHKGIEVLGSTPITCDATLQTASAKSTSRLGSFLAALGNLVAPKPAYAKMFFAAGVGGLTGSFSPFDVTDANGVNLQILSQPTDGYVDTTIPGTASTGYPYVTVQVTTQTTPAKPFVGAWVKVIVANNSGSTVATTGDSVLTNTQGIAVFDHLTVNKAGGYTISVNVADGITGVTQVSTLFNMKNKTAP
jgi:hypothetical protein